MGGESLDKSRFEELLYKYKNVIERFVYYKLPSKTDGDDVLQEVYMKAFEKINMLNDESAFKAWLIRIAQNKCNDYFRARAKQLEIPLDSAFVSSLSVGRFGITESNTVNDTLNMLADKDKQILYLYYFKSKPQSEIAKILDIPLGTVKSRLYNAKHNFKEKYPYPPKSKGEIVMKILPEILPDYQIIKSDKEPFEIKWEELMGWFLVPKLGEKLSWAMYDMPERKRTELCKMQVVGKAQVHGIEGVEIVANEHEPAQFNAVEEQNPVERRFVAQLTETHCRILSESHFENGVKKYFTFLDADNFLDNWGFREDNCGNEINIKLKGDIIRNGTTVKCKDKRFLLDIVGRYEVKIGDKVYDTICIMDVNTYNSGIATEQYLDTSGRTILWRRFNRDDWAYGRYKQKWSEKLPDNERIIINGETFVHWYDCITDYIL